MIKRFRIPLVCRTLSLRRGAQLQGLGSGSPGSRLQGGHGAPPTRGGRCWGGWMWVADIQDANSVFHEAAHALSNLSNNLGCEDEEEFRAYLSGHLFAQIHEWLKKRNNKELF